MRITMEKIYMIIAKKFKNRTKNTKDMGKYVKHKGSLTAIDSFLKKFENVENIKIAKNLLKSGPTVLNVL